MSEEQQQQHQPQHQHQQQQQQQRQLQIQQHQQQQQQQQQRIKSPKDTNNSNTNNASTTQNAATPPRKSNIHEMRNQDFVSRLMAATPPYLYSAPMGPNNFFFSDMLRSLVAARNQENVRNLQLQHSAALARRPRKRTWSQQRSYFKENESLLEKSPQQHQPPLPQLNTAEKPLELTTHKPYLQHLANKYRKLESVANKECADVKQLLVNTKNQEREHDNNGNMETATLEGGAVETSMQSTPPAASLPPQDLVLPPPPPVWYPPLYPPYGIDPLHFFIDLRVSGHIYDRKKENISPLASAENTATANDANHSPPASHTITLPNKHRHGSAFTVPTPRCNDLKNLQHNSTNTTTDAINLSSNVSGINASTLNKFENYAKYYDFGESKENQPNIAKCNANYMLQHLPRLYSQFAARDLFAQAQNESLNHHINNDALESDNKSDNDCEIESDDRHSVANSDDNDVDESSNRERDIDVEIIDSIKYRTDGNSSRCTSPDESSITQID